MQENNHLHENENNQRALKICECLGFILTNKTYYHGYL